MITAVFMTDVMIKHGMQHGGPKACVYGCIGEEHLCGGLPL